MNFYKNLYKLLFFRALLKKKFAENPILKNSDTELAKCLFPLLYVVQILFLRTKIGLLNMKFYANNVFPSLAIE